ncbi:MAG TPA: hypothetical protein VF755_02565 [Catenuloplanes sp.]|jgi:hypothetical protein
MVGLSRCRSVVLGATVAATLVAAGGCTGDDGSGSQVDYPVQPTTAAAEPRARVEPAGSRPAAPPARPALPAAPVRPKGSPPAAVLGAWLGGLGPRGDYDLKINKAGVYRLEHLQNTGVPAFVEQGYVVGDAEELLFRPVQAEGVQARERVARWRRQPNSVIDMLIIHDPVLGELDYVRNDR